MDVDDSKPIFFETFWIPLNKEHLPKCKILKRHSTIIEPNASLKPFHIFIKINHHRVGWHLFPLIPEVESIAIKTLESSMIAISERILRRWIDQFNEVSSIEDDGERVTESAFYNSIPLERTGYSFVFFEKTIFAYPIVINLPHSFLNRMIGRLFHIDLNLIAEQDLLSFLKDDVPHGIVLKSFFLPLEPVQFFNSLSQYELQTMIRLLWANQSITHDMLASVAHSMDNGMGRVEGSLSSHLKADFLHRYQEKKKEYNRHWFEMGALQTLINGMELIKEKKMGVASVDRFLTISNRIKIQFIQNLQHQVPFESIIQQAIEHKWVHRWITNIPSTILSKAMTIFEQITPLFQKEISERAYQMLLSDIQQFKNHIDASTQWLSLYAVYEHFWHLVYDALPISEKKLLALLDSIPKPYHKSLYLNVSNPIDIYLAIKPFSTRVKHEILGYLYPTYKSFVQALLLGDLTLNQWVSTSTIEDAAETLSTFLYQQRIIQSGFH